MVLSRVTRQAIVSLGQMARGLTTTTGNFQQAAAPPPDTIEVFVNDVPVKIPKVSTVMQACDAAGVDIPRYPPAVFGLLVRLINSLFLQVLLPPAPVNSRELQDVPC
jgi:hypothetical protein